MVLDFMTKNVSSEEPQKVSQQGKMPCNRILILDTSMFTDPQS